LIGNYYGGGLKPGDGQAYTPNNPSIYCSPIFEEALCYA
jgi:hypothetical protein